VDQNRRLLLAELEDKVEQIFSAIEQLREVLDDGKESRRLVDEIFRIVHSLKATAASNGEDTASQISHHFENLLHSLRTGKTRLDGNVLLAFDETANALYSALQPGSDSGNLSPLVERLNQLIENVGKRRRLEVELVLNALPMEVWHSLGDAEKHRLEETVSEGANLFLVGTSFDVANFDQQFQGLKDKLADKGEVISTAPKLNSDRPDKIDFRILFARDIRLETLSQELRDFPDVTVSEIAGPTANSVEVSTAEAEDRTRSEAENASTKSNLIRINLDQLDRIISSTHRLYRKTIKSFAPVEGAPADEFKNAAADVRQSFIELAADLVHLRMVSVDRTLQRAARAGRAAAVAIEKEIDFIVTGHELLLDKSLVDAVADPLIHLVRNAVDHGIENREQRLKAGKKAKGTVRIEAVSMQGQTRITVSDDGRGVDPAAVASAASRMGVLDDGAVIGLDHSVRLLFLPGLSTSSKVSDTSGRGVGLDVVETAIEEVGGAVRVASEAGKGSTFEIRLPVTFGLLDVLVIQAGGQSYLVDTAHVNSCEAVGPDIKGGEVLHPLGDRVPVFLLNELLGQTNGNTARDTHEVLFCQLAQLDSAVTSSISGFALEVEAVGERQQVLVRNLGSRGGRWFGVAGAAELDDGSVVLLLDLPRLVLDALKSRSRT
jgi:two-component system, chemotaxis family, sensor kinase CheA